MQSFYPPLRSSAFSNRGSQTASRAISETDSFAANDRRLGDRNTGEHIATNSNTNMFVQSYHIRPSAARSIFGSAQAKQEVVASKGELLDSTWQEQLAGSGKSGLQELLKLIERRLTQFSELNLATALHRLAALGGHQERTLGLNLLHCTGNALHCRPDAFRAQSLANMCWAVARLQWPCQDFLDHLGKAAQLQLVKFKSPELSMVLWGIASSPYASRQTRSDVMEEVASEFLRRGAAAFDAQSVATVAYAAGILLLSAESPLWAVVSTGSKERVEEFSDRQVVNLVWAFATVTNEDGTALFDKVDEAWVLHVKDLAPIDLSLVAWAFAKMIHGSQKFYGEVATAVVKLETTWDQSDTRNIATLIYAFAFAGLAEQHAPAFGVLARAARHRTQDFGMQGLTNAVWGWATACYCEKSWFAAVASEITKRPLCEFEPLDAANCLWAFAAAAYNSDVHLVNHLSQVSNALLSEFTPQNIAISLWSLATLEVRDHIFFEKAADHFVGQLSLCKTQELNNILWACATVSVRLPWLFLKVDAQALVTGLAEFKTHELSIMLWAHGMAGVCNHEFFDAVIEEIIQNRGIETCSPREVANTAWAYSTIIGKANKPWLEAITLYVTPARVAEFDMQCIGNVLWAFATVGVFSKPLFKVACDETVLRCRIATAETIQNISQVVTAVHAARFVHEPFLNAAASCYVGFEDDTVGTREVLLLCNALLPLRLRVSEWHVLEDIVRAKLLAPLLATIPRKQPCPSNEGVFISGHADTWAAFDNTVARLELDHLGVFYTARLLLEAGVAEEVDVFGLETDDLDVGIRASQSDWTRRAARACIEERARILSEGANPESQGGKLTRHLDKVNKRDILAWVSYDVFISINVGANCTQEHCVELGRAFSWRQDIEERPSHHDVSQWLKPLVTKSRQSPSVIGEHDRSGHAERGALLEIASRWLRPPGGIHTNVEGRLQLYVTHFPCISCVCVIAQFARLFPKVVLSISFADNRASNCRDLLSL